MNVLLLTVLLLLSNQLSAKQKFYKWVDKDGGIHYTAEKPKDRDTSEVIVNTSQALVVGPGLENDELTQEDINKEKVDAHYHKKREKNSQAKKSQQICIKAKRNLSEIKKHGRCGWVDGSTGNKYELLNDSKRAEIINKSNTAISKYCK